MIRMNPSAPFPAGAVHPAGFPFLSSHDIILCSSRRRFGASTPPPAFDEAMEGQGGIMKPLSHKKFSYVLEKTDGKCAYCGIKITRENINVDHIVPFCKGGSGKLENLFASCKECNSFKGSKLLEDFRVAAASKIYVEYTFTEEQLHFISERGLKITLPRYVFFFESMGVSK